MKKTFTFLIVISHFSLNAQSFQWAFSEGTSYEDDYGSQITYDQNGSIYVVGKFVDTVDFDPGPGIFNLVSSGTHSSDIFIQKLDANGNLIWAKSLTGQYEKEVSSVTTDHFGNLYLTGYFYNTCDFDPNPAIHEYLTAYGTCACTDVFILKINAAGVLVWVKQIGGLSNDLGMDIAVDPLGDVYVCGTFWDTADFDPGPSSYNLTPDAGAIDAFILKLSPGGGFLWAKQLKGDYIVNYPYITYYSNSLYLCGYYSGNLDVDPSGGTTIFSSVGNSNIFIAKYNDSGILMWGKQFGSSYSDYASDITNDEAGNVYIAGQYGGETDFDPGSGEHIGPYYGSFDCFLLKLNSSGVFGWVSTFGGTNTDHVSEIARGADGSFYLTGDFHGTMDIDPDSTTYSLSSNGQSDAFIIKFDNIGKLNWGISLGGLFNDGSASVTIDNENNLYFTGQYSDVVDFNPESGIYELVNSGSFFDAFVLKLGSDYVGIPTINTNSNDIFLFPNPTSDFINLNWNNSFAETTISIYSIRGQLMYSQQFQQPPAVINTRHFANGVYDISFRSGQKTITKKLVIQHE